MTPVLLSLALDAHAQTAPIRRTRLQDGREFVAEVVGTEATGLRVRVPAGEMLVSFEELLEVKPIDAAAYAAQPSWPVILVAPEELLPAAEGMLNAMPGVIARPSNRPDPSFTPAQLEAMASCGADVTCVRTVVKTLPWHWIVAVETTPTGGARISSLVSTADRALPESHEIAAVEAVALWGAMHEAIGLDLPTSAPPTVPGLAGSKTPKTPKPGKPTGPAVASTGDVFVPIPGWTSFRAGDGGKGALAVVGTLGFTALSAGAGLALSTGAYGDEGSALPAGQAAVFGLAGFLGSTWAFNHLGASGGTAVVPTGTGATITSTF